MTTPHTALRITGMTCGSCAARLQKNIGKLEGIEECTVNYATEIASFTLANPDDLALVTDKVAAMGYGTMPLDITQDAPDPNEHANEWELRAKVGAVMIVVFGIEMIAMALSWPIPAGWMQIVTPLVATFSLFWTGRPFLVKAIALAKTRSANMFTLIAVGSSTAWVYSMVMWLAGWQPQYFDAPIFIISFLSIGQYIEHRAKATAGDALHALLRLSATEAEIERPDGTTVTLPIAALTTGDVVVVKPGATIPADGVVVEGHMDVDEAMVTGESLPVARTQGDEVIGATVNVGGFAKVKVTALGQDSLLGKIQQTVSDAQNEKANAQRVADSISAIFVPTVFAIAALTFGVHWWLGSDMPTAISSAVAVLIIACPCALGLATPMALMVGMGRAAQLGIVFKGTTALEQVGNIHAIAFDKTGTLTEGNMAVQDVYLVGDAQDEATVLGYAMSVEQAAEHPIAKGIVRYATSLGCTPEPVQDFGNTAGKGAFGHVGGVLVSVQSVTTIPVDEPTQAAILAYQHQGFTTVGVVLDGTVAAIIALADTIRPEAPALIANMHERGLHVVMITGDTDVTAQAIAKGLAIDHVLSQVAPAQKSTALTTFQIGGNKVAMVGDGINDAPALTQADIGIAMGSGTNVAIEASDITLVHGNLQTIPVALDLALATNKTIRGNLMWAFGYNTIAIPIAAFGLLNPGVAGAAMAMSSISVILNSMRLRRVGH